MKCEKCGYDDHGTGDSAHVCMPLMNRRESGQVDPVYWEYRTFYEDNTSTPGWGEWQRVEARNPYTTTVEDHVAEIQHYIDNGYKYELRALYTATQPCARCAELEKAVAFNDETARHLS